MVNDPGEMKNLSDDPAYAVVLGRHRAMLKEHGETYGDQLALDMLDPNYTGEPFKKAGPDKKRDKEKGKGVAL
jgi:hypothetical protein